MSDRRTSSEDDLHRLVADAVRGDHDAWRRLVDRYAGLVWAVARRHRLDAADAADVCQVTWLRLAQRLPALRDPARLPAWLVTTTRREAARVRAARHREPPVDLDLVPPTPVEGPEDRVLRDEHDAALWRVFSRLPERCQHLLRMLAVDPRTSYADLARAFDLRPSSVGPVRTRCLRALRGLLAEAGLLPGPVPSGAAR
ncbi:RNA polymerase sigma factor, sigma-70 family [Streptoalloteichus tenebrarius]|uniref:RNA polymerase sigma factor, sigma-70 family n=1 Tax=Streptoalloteichus tenebrarius (strain ATCC 17920 / DSM 40477 / JCM 4838 / CBS 697.72 / NBRC 16177 / NCIMB 11028 / NRRL B-12390 / A12253. 1 / ISP 5477) TaxID=1933 RepID=A0ABT1HV85_STRSD|nr:sigma-70 family RNA polymerase sigma factor [Streptoalloteichus tenebrarius]MCP2259442.1 RNA polymerase sigma factor, sigma-70 family [Streptoalloteichus tenebrarius]BFF02384.1 sigma-70 family RNA polymerase sigma factor [Streptoalloteichus tenebrarius]